MQETKGGPLKRLLKQTENGKQVRPASAKPGNDQVP
jgi:hypothetical protein